MSLSTNAPNRIQALTRQCQSLWLDNLRRDLITSGELARLRDAGVTGITSNPTIFEKAIGGSTDYDTALTELVNAGRRPDQILWDLMLQDIQAAADIFRPVYEATAGSDGFVSIEVGPAIAGDTRQTIATAQDLHRRAARPNVMVKIPATPAGLPAIRHMIGEGKHTNVTLIFSVQRYQAVVEAYLSGLEDLRSKGGDLHQVSSVASFFVSRVDTKVDKLLAARIAPGNRPEKKREVEKLYGKAGIANSKIAYARYRALFSGPRWDALEQAGARVQRCLWASTSVKDARYQDTMYVEELIGPDTVDTVPNATLAAFSDHGRVRRSLEEHVDEARKHIEQLAELGIDMDQVTGELEVEGVESFVKSYDGLLETITKATRKIESAPRGAMTAANPPAVL